MFRLWSTPFFEGSSSVSSVPEQFPVALAGRPFQINLKDYREQFVELQRESQDTSDEPGDQSISRQGYWGRYQFQWFDGAGQEELDAPDSVRTRFFKSKGVNVWSRDGVGLLPATELVEAATGLSVPGGCRVDDKLFFIEGGDLRRTVWTAPGSYTTVSTTGAGTCLAVASNGNTVWAVNTTVMVSSNGGTSFSTFSSHVYDNVWYASGHLFASHQNTLYEISSTGTRTVLYTHPSSAFRWRHVAGGPRRIYAAGDSNGFGEVYWIGYDEATGALNTFATPAADLRSDEYVNVMRSYASVMVLGTNKGLRLAAVADDGALILGAFIAEPGEVKCLEPDGEFMLFGWSNYDATSSGVGRLNLSRFTSRQVPAFASDLMYDGLGAVTFLAKMPDGIVAFGVDNVGVAATAASKVTSGSLETGQIRFGTTFPKVAQSLNVNHAPLQGYVECYLSDAAGVETKVGTSATAGSSVSPRFGLDQMRSAYFNVRFVLVRNGSVNGPTLRSWDLTAVPAPQRQKQILLPLIVKSVVRSNTGEQGEKTAQDIAVTRRFLEDLVSSAAVVTLQVGDRTETVKVDNMEISPHDWTDTFGEMQSNITLRLITIGGV